MVDCFFHLWMLFQRLVDTLSQDEPEVRRRLAEMTRTITVLRVNEKILSRKYTIAQQVETALRQVRDGIFPYDIRWNCFLSF